MKYTLYDILGVSPLANQAAIRDAWLQAQKIYHPDHAGRTPAEADQASAMAKSLNEAYETLSDPVARAAYDDAIGLTRQRRYFWRFRLSVGLGSLTRHRPGDVLRLHRQVKDLPSRVLQSLDPLIDFLWATRGGQWLSLGVMALLLLGAKSLLPTVNILWFVAAAGLFGLWLARAGEPTPLYDLKRLVVFVTRIAFRISRRLLVGSVEALVRLTLRMIAEHEAAPAPEPVDQPARPGQIRREAPTIKSVKFDAHVGGKQSMLRKLVHFNATDKSRPGHGHRAKPPIHGHGKGSRPPR